MTPVLSIEIKEGVIKVSPMVKPLKPGLFFTHYKPTPDWTEHAETATRASQLYEAALLAYEGSLVKVSNPEVLRQFIPLSLETKRAFKDGSYPAPSDLVYELKCPYCDCINNNFICNKQDSRVAVCSFLEPEEKGIKVGPFAPDPTYVQDGYRYTDTKGNEYVFKDGKAIQLKPLPEEAVKEESEVIKFATWYSGMEESKVRTAYERFKKEKLKEVDKQ